MASPIPTVDSESKPAIVWLAAVNSHIAQMSSADMRRHFILSYAADSRGHSYLRDQVKRYRFVAEMKNRVCDKLVKKFVAAGKPFPFHFQRGAETESYNWRVVGDTCHDYEQYLRIHNVDRGLLTADFPNFNEEEEQEALFEGSLLPSRSAGWEKWSRDLIKDVFPYMKPIKDGIGMDQEYLRKFWNLWHGAVEPPVPGCGVFRLPLVAPFHTAINNDTLRQLERFAAPGIIVRFVSVDEVPGFPAQNFDAQSLISAGIQDGTVWNEGIAESLVRFWQEEVLTWWSTAIEAYTNGEDIALQLPQDALAWNQGLWMAQYSPKSQEINIGASNAWEAFLRYQSQVDPAWGKRELDENEEVSE
ncbi:hypothetical protein B0T16DRAFT_462599 [Cercophora newfieldiana]|uniref:Uncharacterized protein n=1 Tax=Cercophora newfieldiana TaxID=92897 RepID=A0AA39XT19_9PEZI|nr:hypothetical protein B0T16DRAFT_462599 [Cercophora newfieldiana]